MLSGIKDVDLQILSELDDRSLLNFCVANQLNRYGKKLCNNELFWKRRFISKFGNVPKSEERTWKDFYLKLIYFQNKYKRNYRPIDNSIQEISEGGVKNIDLINYFISKGGNLNDGMFGAAEGGHQDLVEFFISKGARNWRWGMYHAAEGGHEDLVNFFIKKGARHWNLGLAAAARGGHEDLVDFFIEKGGNNWKEAHHSAIEGGHRDLAYYIITYPIVNDLY